MSNVTRSMCSGPRPARITVTPGETTDFQAIEDWLREVGHGYDLRALRL